MSVLTKLKSSGPGEGPKDVSREALRGAKRGARRGAGLGAIRGSGQAVAKKAQRKSASLRDRVRTQASDVAEGFSRPKRRSKGKIAAVAANIDLSQAKQTADVSGLFGTPGLVDMHVHLFATKPTMFSSR